MGQFLNQSYDPSQAGQWSRGIVIFVGEKERAVPDRLTPKLEASTRNRVNLAFQFLSAAGALYHATKPTAFPAYLYISSGQRNQVAEEFASRATSRVKTQGNLYPRHNM